MRKLSFACVLAFFSAVSALAMPSRSDLQKVQGAVNELMAEDMSAMKKGKLAPEKAAETALGYAREATDEASKFLFYKGAFGLFVQGRKYDEAVKAIETLTEEVKDVPDKVVADIVREKLKRVSKKDGGAVFELYDRIDRRVRSAAEREKLEAALKANPKDAEARRQLAFCKASLGDWAGALGDFALVGGKLSEAAKTEQAGKEAEAADLWWTASDDDADQSVLREHAAGLYRQAMDGGKLQGIKLALAKKRVAECGTDAPAAASAASAPAATESTSVATQSGPKKSSAAPAVRGRYDWTVPAKMKNQKMLDFDFGGGVPKLTFYAIPPGSCRTSLMDAPAHGDIGEKINVTITRPFWIAQLPVTVDQFKLFRDAELVGDDEEAMKKLAGDKNFAVIATTTFAGADAYIAWLNETYGKLLPKGWVFRLPTEAERRFANSWIPWGSPSRGTYVHGDRRGKFNKLKALQTKGLFLNYDTEENADRSERPLWRRLVANYRSFTQNKLICLSETTPSLDAVSTPTIPDRMRGFSTGIQGLLKPILAYGENERDPFRYCSPDAPSRRRVSGIGWNFEEDVIFRIEGVPVQLAVGFDYVGEWKAKQGKK